MRQRNSFDSMRLFGSVIVLCGHAYIITGSGAPDVGGIPLHSLGVCIFFAISGFLITQSWLSDDDWLRYLKRRLLRIVPALFIVVTVTALLLGPLVTTEGIRAYYHHGWTWRYIVSNTLLVTVWGLPGVFETLPIHGQANGSLWTLPIEFALYLLTPFMVIIGRRHKRLGPLLVITVSFFIFLIDRTIPGLGILNVGGIDIGKGMALFPYFWIGSALRLWDLSAWGIRSQRIAILSSLLVATLWAVYASSSIIFIGMIAIAVLVLSVGLQDWFYFETLTRIGDLSYGTYLWAFPIQQIVFYKIGGGPALNVAIAAPLAFAMAYISWHLVERQALRLKPKGRIHPDEEHSPAYSSTALQTPAK